MLQGISRGLLAKKRQRQLRTKPIGKCENASRGKSRIIGLRCGKGNCTKNQLANVKMLQESGGRLIVKMRRRQLHINLIGKYENAPDAPLQSIRDLPLEAFSHLLICTFANLLIKKAPPKRRAFLYCDFLFPPWGQQAYFNFLSSETVSFLRPFLRRLASTLRPLAVSIRLRKPCTVLRRRRCG